MANLNSLLDTAVTLHRANQLQEAKSIYERILEINPNHFDALQLLGTIASQTKNYCQAIQLFDSAIRINSQYAGIYNNRATTFQALGKFENALQDFNQSIVLNPTDAQTYNNRGNTLKELGRLDEAILDFNRAISIQPSYALAYNNKGNALKEKRKISEALDCFEKATSLNPNLIEALWNKSLILLLLGNYEQGWEMFEYRLHPSLIGKICDRREFLFPKWDGHQSINGKNILIFSEQGLGDTIQFCRFIKLLSDRGANVIFEVQEPLYELLQKLDGVHLLIKKGEPPPPCDFYYPLLSLPNLFKITLNNSLQRSSYIFSTPHKAKKWKERLIEYKKLRVGLVWSGGLRPTQPENWAINNRRNIPFKFLANLCDLNIDFFSLQKGAQAELEFNQQKEFYWQRDNLVDFSAELVNFSETAALIENLDLVISVDTSTAHLAAAMGKETWLLNRFDSCWRWLISTEESPWYSSIRIFSQPNAGDWVTVIEKVKQELTKRINYGN
jgi:hypothetical protein